MANNAALPPYLCSHQTSYDTGPRGDPTRATGRMPIVPHCGDSEARARGWAAAVSGGILAAVALGVAFAPLWHAASPPGLSALWVRPGPHTALPSATTRRAPQPLAPDHRAPTRRPALGQGPASDHRLARVSPGTPWAGQPPHEQPLASRTAMSGPVPQPTGNGPALGSLGPAWAILWPVPVAALVFGLLSVRRWAHARDAAHAAPTQALMAVTSVTPETAGTSNVPRGLVDQSLVEGDRRLGRIRIDSQWYDCSGWAKAHPGGERWIRWFDGRDATGVFYALHSYGPNGSSLAADRLARLPKCDPPAELHLPSAREIDVNCSYQELRRQLEEQGYFERSAWREAWALVQVVPFYVVGTGVAYSHPVLATVLLGVGMQQAGWLAHDYIHGRGEWCDSMRWFGAVFNGHSDRWWTQKHSLHHAFTNEEHFDHDIMMEPFFYVRPPEESGRSDSPFRKFQHIYGYPLLSIIFWLWRYLSLKTVIQAKDKKEAALMAINYIWLLTCMPPSVAIGSVFLGGFLVGALVSATHQSEEVMLDGDQPDFVTGQFRSTRDAATVFGPLETFLWGGMDTQLEHHLFPSLPRYNYHKIRPIVQDWAAANDVDYRISPSTTIIADNYRLLKRVADS